MNELCEWFERSLNWASPADPGPWRQEECDNRAAKQLFEAIKMELGPSFEVQNEHRELREDPDLDEYLKNPEEFWRKRNS